MFIFYPYKIIMTFFGLEQDLVIFKPPCISYYVKVIFFTSVVVYIIGINIIFFYISYTYSKKIIRLESKSFSKSKNDT